MYIHDKVVYWGQEWFHIFSELKTSPCLFYISIKSWHFFQVVKKKRPWLGSSVNPEESAVIWGLNEATQTVWHSTVCVEEQSLHYSCTIVCKWYMNLLGGAFRTSLRFMFTSCDLQGCCCADESSTSAFNALTKTFTTSSRFLISMAI